MATIYRITTDVKEFPLKSRDGTDSIYSDPVYSYIVTYLKTDNSLCGTGIVFTVGSGNRIAFSGAYPAFENIFFASGPCGGWIIHKASRTRFQF